MRGGADLLPQLLGLAFQPGVPLGPPGVRLPVVAAVAGVGAQRPAQRRKLRVVGGRGRPCRTGRAAPCRSDDAGVAQRRREVAAYRGRPVVDVLGQPHPAQRRDGGGEVGGRQAPGPAVLGEHQRPRIVAAGHARVEDDGQPGPPPARHRDDVAGPQRAQRVRGGVALLGHPLAAQRLLPLGDPAAQRGVLGEVAEVAAHRARVPGEGLGVAFDPPGQADHRPVGLELPERLLEQLAGPAATPSRPTRLTAML